MRLVKLVVVATALGMLTSCGNGEATSSEDNMSEATVGERPSPTPSDDYTGDGLGESPPPDNAESSSTPEASDADASEDGCIPVDTATAVVGLSLKVASLSDGIIRDCLYEDLDQFGWFPAFVRVYSAGHPEVASWDPSGQPPSDNTRGVYGVEPTVIEGKDRSIYSGDGQCSVVTRPANPLSMAMITVYNDSVSALSADPCQIAQDLADQAEALPPVE